MARSRSLPTDLFEQPDFFELESETQIILIGLVLHADDYGRGIAHSRLLARKLDKEEPLVEQALVTLEARDLLRCYQVGRGHYYALTCWQEWQTLHKPTPSKYPAPPEISPSEGSLPSSEIRGNSAMPRISSEYPGKVRDILPEEEGEGEQEEEQHKKRKEDEGAEDTSHKIVPLHPTPTDVGNDTISLSEEIVQERTHQVAQILQIPVSDALTRVVADYAADPAISLLGQADAAREWIDDRHRNHHQRQMSPAFFRRWLNREHASIQARQAPFPTEKRVRNATGSPRRTTLTSHDPYAAFIERRVQEVKATAPARRALVEQEAVV